MPFLEFPPTTGPWAVGQCDVLWKEEDVNGEGNQGGGGVEPVPQAKRSSWFAYFIHLPRSLQGVRSRRGQRGFQKHMGPGWHATAVPHL